jgi:transcriptional regulator with XRE-family HTH domain
MGGQRKGPRARDRSIGAKLRSIRRERTNLSLEDAAERCGWSPSTMSRIENGKRHVSTEDIATICTVFKLPTPEREELIQEAREGSARGWWDRPLPGVPKDIGALASYEADAVRLTDWSVNLVPGLLHTYDYAVAMMAADGVPPDDIEMRWMARLRRQQILGTVDYTAFIGEAALRIPFGGPASMRGQLRHLIDAHTRGIRIRIVPEHLPHSMLLHSWLFMEFSQTSPVVNVEIMNGGFFLLDEDAEHFIEVLHRLDKVALSATASRSLLRKALEEV